MLEGFFMRHASSVACFTGKGSAPKSWWARGLVLDGLLVMGLPATAVRADTTLNSGTTTVSTDRNFGDNLYVATTGTGTLTMSGGLVSVSGTVSQGAHGTIHLNSGGTLEIGVGGTTGVLGVSTLTNNWHRRPRCGA